MSINYLLFLIDLIQIKKKHNKHVAAIKSRRKTVY